MDELYNILESYNQKNDPRFIYDGLYEEPADTSINLDPMYDIGSRQFGDIRAGFPHQGIFNTVQANNFTSQAPSQKFEFLPEAYDQSEDFEQVDSLTGEKKSNGIMDFLSNFPSPLNLLRSIAQNTGQPYESYTPGGTIRDGIYSIGGVNVPVSMMNDFYNPRTGLNRFDRARQRYEQTGKVTDLFASSRTGKEFFEKMRERKAQKQKALEDAAAAKRKFTTYTSGGGDRDPGPRRGAADIDDKNRGSYATDDIASFF